MEIANYRSCEQRTKPVHADCTWFILGSYKLPIQFFVSVASMTIQMWFIHDSWNELLQSTYGIDKLFYGITYAVHGIRSFNGIRVPSIEPSEIQNHYELLDCTLNCNKQMLRVKQLNKHTFHRVFFFLNFWIPYWIIRVIFWFISCYSNCPQH